MTVLHISEKDRILIVAPHPDDETIGCGGILALYGKQCTVLLLTDGRKGYESSVPTDEDALAAQREKELEEVCNLANVVKVDSLGIHDYHLSENKDIVLKYDIKGFSKIFVPNRFERHKDHKIVFDLFKKMIKIQRVNAQLYEYEVWSPLPSPTHMLDISELIDTKLEMIKCYKSQLKFLNYESLIEGLNLYRGASFKTGYAETYSLYEDVGRVVKAYRKLPYSMRHIIWQVVHKNKHTDK